MVSFMELPGLAGVVLAVAAGDRRGQVALAGLVHLLAVLPAQQVVVARLQPLQAVHVLAGEADQVGGQVAAGHLAALVAVARRCRAGPAP